MDPNKDPRDIDNYHLFVTRTVSNREVHSYPGGHDQFRRMCEDKMRDQIVSYVSDVRAKVEEMPDAFATRYMMDVYIVPSDVFWQLVEREAQKIAVRFMRPIDPTDFL